MEERYSNKEDCYKLALLLKKELKDKIDFYGSINTSVPSGKYLSSYRKKTGENLYNGKCLPFYFKYKEDDFLRISIGSHHKGSSLGEKLAALSDFYEVLKKYYGLPDVFYTIKNDQQKTLSLQWSFRNKEEDLKKFKSNTYFTDGEIEDIIIIRKENDIEKLKTFEETKIDRKTYLPEELLSYIYLDLEEFIKHKKGEEVHILNNNPTNDISWIIKEKRNSKKYEIRRRIN